MDQSPNLSLPYLLPNQAQKHVTVNEALRLLDSLVQLRVLSRTTGTPPASPVEGDRYVVPAGASGAWAGSDGAIAAYIDGAWALLPAQEGHIAWVSDEAVLIVRDGSGWTTAVQGEVPLLGINATADIDTRLAVASTSSLFSHAGAGHQLKINRLTGSDTASLLFETDHSAQAEAGFAGDSVFRLKVAPAGDPLSTALSVDPATGYLGAGTDMPASRLHIRQAADARLTIETTSAGTGGGFDIINSGSDQSWRVTGQADLLKFRDHTNALDKLILETGAAGNASLQNIQGLGIGTGTPTARLHVQGTVRIGSFVMAGLPAAGTSGAGTLAYVSDAAGGARLAWSDGTNWRRIDTNAVLA